MTEIKLRGRRNGPLLEQLHDVPMDEECGGRLPEGAAGVKKIPKERVRRVDGFLLQLSPLRFGQPGQELPHPRGLHCVRGVARSLVATLACVFAAIFLFFLTSVVWSVWWQLITLSVLVFVVVLPLTLVGWFVALVGWYWPRSKA